MNRLMPVLLMLALSLSPVLTTFAQQQLTDPSVVKVKADVARRLRDARTNVTIRLQSGSELKGRITQAAENMFTLKEKDGAPRYISYAEVTKVKGGGLSKGTKFGILTGVVAGAFIIGAFVSMKDFDPFKNGVLR